MTFKTNNKNNLSKKTPFNHVLFLEEDFSNLSSLKKHTSKYEYSFIEDILKSKDKKNK